MRTLPALFANNARWATSQTAHDAEFFTRLTHLQRPSYLWIGCADSRVPANEIVGLAPGEMFVHRNVANLVALTDINCMSAVEYAVEVLGVRHIIVCGHYGCGGVTAALGGQTTGTVDTWLAPLRQTAWAHRDELAGLESDARARRLCELNVIEQVGRLAVSEIARRTWERGLPLSVHGWIYDLADGLLRDLNVTRDAHE